jgi:hypothetical protein
MVKIIFNNKKKNNTRSFSFEDGASEHSLGCEQKPGEKE